MHYEDEQVEIHKVVVGPYDNNVFVVRCRQTGDALLIDAANEHEQLLELCSALGVRKVVETHGHWDHIQAVPQLRDAGYEVAVTSRGRRHAAVLRPAARGRRLLEVGQPAAQDDRTPRVTLQVRCASSSRVLPCSSRVTRCSPAAPATRRPTSEISRTIIESIERRIFAPLPPDTIVMPGHGARHDDRGRTATPRTNGSLGAGRPSR